MNKIVRVPLKVTLEVTLDDDDKLERAWLLLESTTKMPSGEYQHDQTWMNVSHYTNLMNQIDGALPEAVSEEALGGEYV